MYLIFNTVAVHIGTLQSAVREKGRTLAPGQKAPRQRPPINVPYGYVVSNYVYITNFIKRDIRNLLQGHASRKSYMCESV